MSAVRYRESTAEELADPSAETTLCIIEGCGGAYTFDPLLEGETCGGNQLVGWLVCDRCGGMCITRRARPGGAWKLAASGVSIEAGRVRVRAEGSGAREYTQALMARIVRVPHLEAALRAIARGDADPEAIARAALGVA